MYLCGGMLTWWLCVCPCECDAKLHYRHKNKNKQYAVNYIMEGPNADINHSYCYEAEEHLATGIATYIIMAWEL